MGLGDRIAVMAEGRIRQLGTPFEVYDDPADTFVATFLGSPPMNMVQREDTIVGFRPEALLPKGVVDADARRSAWPSPCPGWSTWARSGRWSGRSRAWARPPGPSPSCRPTCRYRVPAGETSEFVVRGADLRFFDKGTGLRLPRRML